MRIYWRAKSVPELASLPIALQRQLWQKYVTRSRWNWGLAVPGICLYLLAVYYIDNIGSLVAEGCGLLLAVVSAIGTHIAVTKALPSIRKEVRGMCVKCGYNLTGNVSGVCPECGTAVTSGDHAPSKSPPPG
jgi:hypothetical protein